MQAPTTAANAQCRERDDSPTEDQVVCLYDISWDDYERFLDMRADHSAPRVSYTSYRHKLTFFQCLEIQCEQRFQLLPVRCVCLVKAISNSASEVGEIGVVFRVKNLFR